MERAGRASLMDRLASDRTRDYLTIWAIVLLTSGQGFRYLLGIPAYAALAALTVTTVAVSFRASIPSLRIAPIIYAYTGLATLSILWSATRTVTVIAVVALLATTYMAVASVRRTSALRFMELLYRGLQISLFIGIAFEMIVAFIIRSPISPLSMDLAKIAGVDAGAVPIWSENNLLEGGPIQGFVGNRNPFAAIALLTTIVTVILMLERRLRRPDAIVTLAAAFAVYLLTASATVTVTALYVAALALSAVVIRRVATPIKRTLSFGVLGVSAVAAVVTIKYRDQIFGAFDRNPDATNRTEIWNQAMSYAQQRPDGYGFVGYWPIWAEPYKSINSHFDMIVPHAHNAFIDAWLQLGLIGLVLLVVIVVLVFGSAWRLVERADKGDTYVPLGWALLIAALLLQSLTESRLLIEGGWFLLVALFCSGPAVFKLTIVDPELVHTGSAAVKRSVPFARKPHTDDPAVADGPASADDARQ